MGVGAPTRRLCAFDLPPDRRTKDLDKLVDCKIGHCRLTRCGYVAGEASRHVGDGDILSEGSDLKLGDFGRRMQKCQMRVF